TPVEIDLFFPQDQKKIRQTLNLPLDKKLLLFVAMNVAEERKGFRYLKESLDLLLAKDPSLKDRVEVLVLGKASEEQLSVLGFKVNHLGFLSQPQQIAAAYGACDLFVMPSLEDNLPNVVLESMACGRPVVAFETGGIPEMVEHLESGYIAQFKDAADLAQGILTTLAAENWEKFSTQARTRILEHFSDKIVSDQYQRLYQKLIAASS
ncbi:MAG: glycosyltransferase, partial [Saprospiraceae bacterium]